MKFYIENYLVDNSDVDRDYYIQFPRLLEILATVATKHSAYYGIDPFYLGKYNMTWVLYENSVTLTQNQNLYATYIKIKTFVQDVKGIYILRYFGFYDQHDNLIGKAISKWVTIDFVKRKLVKIPPEALEKISTVTKDLMDEQKQITKELKLKKQENLNLIELYNKQNTQVKYKEFEIRYYDIDDNMHVNNAIYARWAVESLCMNKDFLLNHKVYKLNITYKKEQLDDGKYVKCLYTKVNLITHHEIYSSKDELLSILDITWIDFNTNIISK